MTITQLYLKMLHTPGLPLRDVNHLTKVWAYARNIGEAELLPPHLQWLTEAAAILHDIACPKLREQYGRAIHTEQERIGPDMAREFLKATDLSREDTERLCFLIAHHHTPEAIDGMDFQILIEADYLVNADESGYAREPIQRMYDTYFRTETGRGLLRKLYLER